MKSILSVLLVINFMMMQFINHPYIDFFVGVYVCFYIVASLRYLKGMSAKITIGLLVTIPFLLIGNEKFYIALVEGATTNLAIVIIIILTPLLGIPVRVGDYLTSLSHLLSKLKSNVAFIYTIFLSLTHVFSVILNIGAVVINLHLIGSSHVKSKRLIGSLLIRGYTTMWLWSPYTAVMIIVINPLGLAWGELALYMIGFALLALIVGVLIEFKEINQETKRVTSDILHSEQGTEHMERSKVFLKMAELFVLMALSMALVLILEQNTNLGMVLSIAIVAVVFPIVWCLLKRLLPQYKKEVITHVTKTVPNMQSEFTMFLVAGVFSHAFVQSPLSDQFVHMLNALFGSSSLLMSVALSLTIILTSIVGLHAAVMLTIFATALNPELIGFTPVYFAVLLLGSASIANAVSTGSALSNFLAKELKTDVFTVSFKWNWLYAASLFIVFLFYLQFVIV